MKSQASAIALPLAVLAAVVLASCGEDSPTAPLSASGVELTAPKPDARRSRERYCSFRPWPRTPTETR